MTKYEIVRTKPFKKAVKNLSKKDFDLLEHIINRLANDEILEAKYKDHPLQGDRKGCRDCHIRDDFVFVYKKNKQALTLVCINAANHNNVFKNKYKA